MSVGSTDVQNSPGQILSMVAAPVLEIIEQAETVDRAAAPAFAVYLRETFKMPKVWHQGAKPAQESAKHSEDMKIFDFEGQNVRTVQIENEPWFVLGDVCKVLEISNPTMVKERLSSDNEVSLSTTEVQNARGQMRKTAIVNESGLYDVILDSRKPQAKQFRRWVTSEVIPSIRKHGGYLTPEKVEETLLNPDTIIQLAQNLKAEQEVMEIKNIGDQKKRLDQADRTTATVSDGVQNRRTTLINESGLYDVKRRLNSEDVSTTHILDSRGHNRKNFIINESGLYDVILDSRKQLRASEREIQTL